MPESFSVLINELRGLCLDMQLLGGDAEKPSSRQAAVPAVTPLVASSSVTGIGGMNL